jgi:hypothetical protein
VEPAEPEDAHRPLEKSHDLKAILSHVEQRIVKKDYTFQFEGTSYVIERADVTTGLRGAAIRVEKRRDGTLAIRFEDRYLRYRVCEAGAKLASADPMSEDKGKAKRPAPKRSTWMKGFFDKKGPSLRTAIGVANATS